MKLQGLSFLRDGNVVSPSSGALITWADLCPGASVEWRLIQSRVGRLPVSLRFPDPLNACRSDRRVALPGVVAALLWSLTEHVRLFSESVRVLNQDQSTCTFWLPVDDRVAAEAAAGLVLELVPSSQDDVVDWPRIAHLWAVLRSRFWNQTHAHLARAAHQEGISFCRLDRLDQQFLQLGQGASLRLFRETLTDRTPIFSRSVSDKQSLHRLMSRHNIPLPPQARVAALEIALTAAERIGWPVVLKPANGAKGRGVWVGLSDPDALRQAWQECRPGEIQLIQRMLPGSDHRLLVVDGQLMAVAQRRPATLISDGQRPVKEQIDAINASPERGEAYERLMNRIPVDARLELLLAEQGLSLQAVPPAGLVVQLSRAANISQGGTAVDFSQLVHPDNRRLAEDIARLIGTDVVGLDVISQDIAISWRKGGTWLLEANLSPGLRPHLVADPEGDLCRRVVRRWMGDAPRAGKIPTALITGSIGKTTTSRILAHLLQTSGLRVGLTSTTGMELDGHVILSGDLAGGRAACHLLQDRRVEALVAEIARGGILKSGLGTGPVDVAAVLNVLDNHVGNDGIRSRDDLARVKALVADAAERLVALNADDPLVLRMAQHRPSHCVALVSEEPGNPAWHSHRREGHLAVLFSMESSGTIQIFRQDERCLEIGLREIPASDGGAIGTIAPAAAFASALAHALGVELDQIHHGLLSFGRKEQHRYGRFEVLIHEPWRVLLTWADGPEALESLSKYALAATTSRHYRRILLCSAPDNRSDAFLVRMGMAVWGFDLVIFASWDQRKGRSSAEVPALLAQGAATLGSAGPRVLVSDTETDALAVLVSVIRPGDLCVVCSYQSGWMRSKLLSLLIQ